MKARLVGAPKFDLAPSWSSMPWLSAYLRETRSPVDLAVTRIVVFGLLAFLCVWEHPVWMAGLPKDLLFPPPLTGWLTAFPIAPGPVRAAQVMTLLAAIAATLGVAYRVSAPLAVLGSLYVLGVPELWGKVNHYHNITWFAAILAVSPATDALTLGKRGIPSPSPAYGRPLAFMGLLIGLAYYWPGIAKASTGLSWIWSDNLKYILYQKWAELSGFTPLVPLDHWPLMLRLSALSVVCFELLFLWLIIIPRLRPWAVAGGLAFHAACAVVIGINFWPLWACYVVFVPWGRLVTPTTEPGPERRAVSIVAGALLVTVVLAYPLGLDSWPIAYYPTFAGISGPTRTIVRAEGLDPAVERRIIRHMEGSRWYTILARAARHPDSEVRSRTLRGIAALLAREDPHIGVPRLTVVQQRLGPQ